MKKLSSKDRKSLIRLASKMAKGSPEKRAILAGLKKAGDGITWEAKSKTPGKTLVFGYGIGTNAMRAKLVDDRTGEVSLERPELDEFDFPEYLEENLQDKRLLKTLLDWNEIGEPDIEEERIRGLRPTSW